MRCGTGDAEIRPRRAAPVGQGQRGHRRPSGTGETHVVWFITQRPVAYPLRPRSGGQRRELAVTRRQPERPAEQRSGRLTRCTNRPSQLVIRSLHLSVPGTLPGARQDGGSPRLTPGKVQKGLPIPRRVAIMGPLRSRVVVVLSKYKGRACYAFLHDQARKLTLPTSALVDRPHSDRNDSLQERSILARIHTYSNLPG